MSVLSSCLELTRVVESIKQDDVGGDEAASYPTLPSPGAGQGCHAS